jgi:hypothetical protein
MEEHVHCENCGREILISELQIPERRFPHAMYCNNCNHPCNDNTKTHQIRLKGMMVKKPKCPYHKGDKCAIFKVNDEHPYCEPHDHCKLKYVEGGMI